MIRNKWIYKVKFNSIGDIEKYKARLVAKGFAQKYSIDYEKTFSPMAKMPTVRIIFALFAAQGWKFFQLDVKSAFLNGDLDVEIFMNQPKWFVCKLKKSLYGLKQAPRAWYMKILGYFVNIGFSKCFSDSDLYVLNQGKDMVLILLYVDDLLITRNNDEIIQECISKLKATFERHFLKEIGYEQGGSSLIFSDNQSAISLAKNPMFHQRTKHVEIHAYFIKEKVLDGIIHLEYCPSTLNSTDLFTKTLPEAQFCKLRDAIELVKLPSRGSEVLILIFEFMFVMTTSALGGLCVV